MQDEYEIKRDIILEHWKEFLEDRDKSELINLILNNMQPEDDDDFYDVRVNL